MRWRDEYSGGGLYRSREGWIFGVCRGVADYLNISVLWTRVLAVLFFLFVGFWPAGVVYLLAALLMRLEPGSGCARFSAAWRIRGSFDGLDQRLQRLEMVVTGRERDWDARLRDG